MQEIDYRWFEENCEELHRQYAGMYIAIKDKHVLGSFPTYAEAVHETEKAHTLGSFIVERCVSNAQANTVYIASAHFMPEEALA